MARADTSVRPYGRHSEGCVGAAYMRPTCHEPVGSHICDPYRINPIRYTLHVKRASTKAMPVSLRRRAPLAWAAARQ